MRVRPFGRLPFAASIVGLGTSQLSNLSGRFPGVRRIAPDEARAVISAALDRGINFFDTADAYGDAEELLGSVGLSTNDAVVATKAGLTDDGRRDFSPAYIRARVERSLKRLKTDRLGLFQLNKPVAQDWKDGSLAGLLGDLKREGKIRWAGVIVGRSEDGDAALDSGATDAVQVLYNVLYAAQAPLMTRAAERGVAVIVRSPLNSGLLSGVHTERSRWPANDERSRYFQGKTFEARIAAVKAIQEGLSIPPAAFLEFALRFAFSGTGVCTVIPGASSAAQASRYAACGDSPDLPPETIARAVELASHALGADAGPFQGI